MRYVILIFCLGLIQTTSCTENAIDTSSEVTQEAITLQIIDTLGVDVGDSNYVFGNIVDAAFFPDGRIVLLDVLMNKISVFSPECEFLFSFGNEGNGPGEFAEPVALTILEDEGLAVCDHMHRKIVYFDSLQCFVRELSGFNPLPPASIENGLESSIVGMQSHYYMDSGTMNVGVRLGSWSQSVEPDMVFTSFYSVPTDNSVELFSVRFCTDSQGKVYTVPTSYDEYSITCYSPEGDTLFYLPEPYTRIEKTQEEIEFEHMCYRYDTPGFDADDRQAIAARWEPDPYRLAIKEIYADEIDRIWVLSGRSEDSSPLFEVYNNNGTSLATVQTNLPIESLNWKFIFGRDKVLAFDTNPPDYSKIYILEIQN